MKTLLLLLCGLALGIEPKYCPCHNWYTVPPPPGYTAFKNYQINLYKHEKESYAIVLEPKTQYHLSLLKYEGDYLARVEILTATRKEAIATLIGKERVAATTFEVREKGIYYIEYTKVPAKKAKIKYYCASVGLSTSTAKK